MKRLLAGLPLLFFTVTNLLAQSSTPEDMASPTPIQLDEKAVAGVFAALIGGGIIGCVFFLVIIAVWLWIAIWIMKDSARRQSPNRTLVVVLGWLVPLVGLIVHLATRPKTIPGAPNP